MFVDELKRKLPYLKWECMMNPFVLTCNNTKRIEDIIQIWFYLDKHEDKVLEVVEVSFGTLDVSWVDDLLCLSEEEEWLLRGTLLLTLLKRVEEGKITSVY